MQHANFITMRKFVDHSNSEFRNKCSLLLMTSIPDRWCLASQDSSIQCPKFPWIDKTTMLNMDEILLKNVFMLIGLGACLTGARRDRKFRVSLHLSAVSLHPFSNPTLEIWKTIRTKILGIATLHHELYIHLIWQCFHRSNISYCNA